MRKKSHILLARYLSDQMAEAESLQMHRKAFCIGSILPDCKPSFLTTRHEYFTTIEYVQKKIRFMVEHGLEFCSESAFWRKIGEIIHYIADYFTFPHNRTFTGTLMEHNQYEKELKNRLRAYIESGQAELYTRKEKAVHFGNVQELFDYLQERHDIYLKKMSNIAEDIRYILSVCLQVVQGMFQLCTEGSALRLAIV